MTEKSYLELDKSYQIYELGFDSKKITTRYSLPKTCGEMLYYLDDYGSININYTKQFNEEFVNISANADSDWVDVSIDEDNASINIEVEENNGTDRTSIITISQEPTRGKTVSLTIKQLGNEQPISGLAIGDF